MLISLSVETKSLDHLKKLKDANMPVVLLDRIIENDWFPHIHINDEKVAASAVEFLIEKGHKNILGIFDDPRLKMTKFREAGFKNALLKNGIPVNQGQILKVRDDNLPKS